MSGRGVGVGILTLVFGCCVSGDLDSLKAPQRPVTRTDDGTPVSLLTPDEFDSWKRKEQLRSNFESSIAEGYGNLLKLAGATLTCCALASGCFTPRKY